MTKNEEISDSINPLNKLTDCDFIEGLGKAIVEFFKPDIDHRDTTYKVVFYFIQREVFTEHMPFTFLDVTPINEELQEMNTGWLKESSVHFLGRNTNLTSQIAEHVHDAAIKVFLKNISIQQMNFSINNFEPKLPTLKIKSAINETLEKNYWL